MTDGRRSDTRERIQQVALELFAERGYEKTTLREIAERLDVTRPALYYHFDAKEDILAGIVSDLAVSLDELVAWGTGQPATPASRKEVLRRLALLVNGDWRPFMRFSQENEAALRDLKVASEFRDRMHAISMLVTEPGGTLADRLRGRLAVAALFMGCAKEQELGGTDKEREAAAFEIALGLLNHTS